MTQTVQRELHQHQTEVLRLCRDLDVKRLRLFGSALSDSFDPATSDLDIIVDFHHEEHPGIADRFLSLAEGLENIFHRPVDLLTEGSIRNPILKKTIQSASVTLYEPRSHETAARYS